MTAPTVTITEAAPPKLSPVLHVLQYASSGPDGFTGTVSVVLDWPFDDDPDDEPIRVTISGAATSPAGRLYAIGAYGWPNNGVAVGATVAAALDAILAAVRTEVERSDAYRAAAAEALATVERQIARLEQLRAQLASAAQADR